MKPDRTYYTQEFNYYSFQYSKYIPMLLPPVLFLLNFYFVSNNNVSTMDSYDYSGWLMDAFRLQLSKIIHNIIPPLFEKLQCCFNVHSNLNL